MSEANPRTESLFWSALAISSPEERARYLDQACGGDQQLRGRIEELLAAYPKVEGFLELRAPSPAVTVDEARATERPGTVIGPYKLLQPIGEGGMGTVFLAEQTRPVHRKVALKVIKSGMDSRQVIARFEAERQALAMMDHVNIARVFDGGTTENGRPYFVMELVHGVPITKYCDDNRLTPRERLELFVPVCQAIQHAHQKGIIHRDVKPSNVMITPYDGKPVPKVIDFGVAKATEQKLTERTLFTQYGTMVGTLEYMSPEQAEMSAPGVDTRSDIYSLGVLLYELLTGSTPLTHKRMKEAAYAEIVRMIKEEEPPKPSTRLSESGEALASISAQRHTEPAKLTKLVRGELDWIVMKCLEKDRNRRYETTNGLAMDVQRYLNDEPVAACPPSATYRLRKFVRRNKAGLAVAGLVFFFVVLLGAGIGWAVRDRAERENRLAAQVEQILDDVDRLEGEQKWSEALAAIERAEAALTSGEAGGAIRKRVSDVHRCLAFVRRLERIRESRNTIVDAKLGNRRAVRDYLELFREYGVDVETLPAEEAVARLRTRPALAVPIATALDDCVATWRLLDEGEPGWRLLVAVARGLDPDPLRDLLRAMLGQPITPESRAELRRLAESIDVKAQMPATLVTLGRALNGAQLNDSAIQILEVECELGVQPVIGRVGMLCLLQDLLARKDYAGAVRYFSILVSLHPDNWAAHANLGAGLYEQRKYVEAEAEFREAIHREPHEAVVHRNLGAALERQGKNAEAEAEFREAIRLKPENPLAHDNLGVVLARQSKYAEAVDAHREAIRLKPDANAYYNLGVALERQGKRAEAVDACREAIRIKPDWGLPYYMLGRELIMQGKWAEAIQAWGKLVELEPWHALRHNQLAWLLATCSDPKFRDPPRAVALAKKAVELEPKNGLYWKMLGVAQYRAADWKASIAALEKSMALRNGGNSFDWFFLAMASWKQGDKEKARQWYDRAVQWMEKNAPPHEELRRFRAEAEKVLELKK
jgi:serine/threonine protein kinase/tetratricopeptide (TPR) repeat protein